MSRTDQELLDIALGFRDDSQTFYDLALDLEKRATAYEKGSAAQIALNGLAGTALAESEKFRKKWHYVLDAVTAVLRHSTP